MINKFLAALLISAATVSACATTSNKAEMTDVESSNLKQAMLSEKPNVIISRIGSPPLALASRVKVNGTEVARLMISEYTEFYLEPGNHDIAIRYNPLSMQQGDDLTLTVVENMTYTFDIGGGLSVSHKAGITSGGVRIKLTPQDPKRMAAYLDQCCGKIEIQPR